MPILKAIARRLLSPGEQAALKALLNERIISGYHRAGLRQVRKQCLTRPARLNLGSGRHRKPGFLNVDLFPGGDLTLDLRRGLPFDSDCCELIFSEHFFEHIDYPGDITFLLVECLRVIRPGGALRFSIPDTQWLLTDYGNGPDAPFFKACKEHRWHPESCRTRLEHINYHFRQDGEHRFAYDFETIEKLLREVGFLDVQQVAYDPALDSKHRQVGSLFISARKPGNRSG